MGKVWGILLVAVIVAFLAGLGVDDAANLTGNATGGAWDFISTFFDAATGNDNDGEAVG